MDHTALHNYIKQVSKRMVDADLPLIASCAQHRILKKGEVLLKEGEMCRTFYLVEKGHLRTYYNKDGVAINLNFTFEGEFTTNFKSINNKEGSAFFIEAGEKSVIWTFNLDSMSAKFADHRPIELFIRRLAVRILFASEEHSNLFKLYTPTERYHYIEKNNPTLLQRISLSQLASYIGITRETLSRIRRKKS